MAGPMVGLGPYNGGYRYGPVNQVTPFTYRDNATYLTILNDLSCRLNTIITEVNDALTAQDAEVQADLAAMKTYIDSEIARLEALIIGSHDESIAFDPTNGTRTEGLSTVVSRVYDNVRIYAYFAKQYDDLNMTAATYDGIGYSARHFDLGVTYPTFNDVMP